MSFRPKLRPLPESDRRQSIAQFLTVLDQHPDLAHFRAIVRTGPERQLALMAALERAVVVGPPAYSPPTPDDQADILLCDILDCIDRHPDLKNHGSAYGPDRHLASLQAFGIWRGRAPINRPTARELFATTFSHLTADSVTDLLSSGANYSPAPQDVVSGGELIGPADTFENPSTQVPSQPQTLGLLLVASTDANHTPAHGPSDSSGIIRHDTPQPGEIRPLDPSSSPSPSLPLAPSCLPIRPLRRGRPVKLDDLAKGRLLGLMSYGLSFRQAAAQLGVHHQTLLNLLKRDEEFAQQVSEARLDAVSQPLLTVVQASRTSWRAAAWLAKFLEDRRLRSYETTPEERELQQMRK